MKTVVKYILETPKCIIIIRRTDKWKIPSPRSPDPPRGLCPLPGLHVGWGRYPLLPSHGLCPEGQPAPLDGHRRRAWVQTRQRLNHLPYSDLPSPPPPASLTRGGSRASQVSRTSVTRRYQVGRQGMKEKGAVGHRAPQPHNADVPSSGLSLQQLCLPGPCTASPASATWRPR